LVKFTNFMGLTSYDETLIRLIEDGREPVQIPFIFNTYTHLWDMLIDYGLMGLLLIMFLLGVLSSYLWLLKFQSLNIKTYDVVLQFTMAYLLYGFSSSITSFSTVWYGFIFSFVFVYYSSASSQAQDIFERDTKSYTTLTKIN
jgi:hypothetical protein